MSSFHSKTITNMVPSKSNHPTINGPIALIACSSQYSSEDVEYKGDGSPVLHDYVRFMESNSFGRNNKFISPGLIDQLGVNHQATVLIMINNAYVLNEN